MITLTITIEETKDGNIEVRLHPISCACSRDEMLRADEIIKVLSNHIHQTADSVQDDNLPPERN